MKVMIGGGRGRIRCEGGGRHLGVDWRAREDGGLMDRFVYFRLAAESWDMYWQQKRKES